MLNWINYWQSNPKIFGIVMEKSTGYFANKLISKGLIKNGDKILDFGCGPGYLTEHIMHLAGSYWGVDISPTYIDSCVKKYNGIEKLHFTLLDDNNKIFPSNADNNLRDFNVIIILSVVQYFTDKTKVAQLLKNCKDCLKPGGKIILADVIQSENSLIRDLWNVLINSIREGYFLSFLYFMQQIKFSSYNKMRKNHSLLCLNNEDVSEICNNLGLNFEVLPSITLQKSRVSYCLKHK